MAWINFTNFTGNSATFPGDYLVGYIGAQEQRYPVVALKNGLSAGLFTAQNLLVTEDTTIRGNLSVLGSQSVFETIVSVTSALSVVNTGTGPALTVKQTGTEPIALFLDDNNNTFRIDDNFKVSFFNSHATGSHSIAEGNNTVASGDNSHAQGNDSISSGTNSHAQGSNVLASGHASHAQGQYIAATGDYSHAEGYVTTTGRRNTFDSYTAATKTFTFAPAISANFAYVVPGTILRGYEETAFGVHFIITVDSRSNITGDIVATADAIGGDTSGAPGYLVDNSGSYSHAEGDGTTASGQSSHAEGSGGIASGQYSHAEGYLSTASDYASHAEGYQTTASGQGSHAEGQSAVASGLASHAEGESTVASGTNSHAEGKATLASGNFSHAEGQLAAATGNYSHAEGFGTSTGRHNAFATYTAATKIFTFTPDVSANFNYVTPGTVLLGYEYTNIGDWFTITVFNRSSTTGAITATEDRFGSDSTSGYLIDNSGNSSHAEGYETRASGIDSHAEGDNTTASGDASHAEGSNTLASGAFSHAEGASTVASGNYSHAEGAGTTASGAWSHAAGSNAQAAHDRTWVWKGSTNTATMSTTRTDQFMVSAANGLFLNNAVGINTDNNTNALTVNGAISGNDGLSVNAITGRNISIVHTPANDGTNPFIQLGEFTTGSTTASAFSGFRFEYNEPTNILGLSSLMGVSAANILDIYPFDGITVNQVTRTRELSVIKSSPGSDAAITILAGNTLGDAASLFFGHEAQQTRGQIRYYNGGVEAMAFTTSTVEAMRIRAGGQVGIGTTLPNEKLTVLGNISASGSLIGHSLTSRNISLVHTPANDGTNPYIQLGEFTTGSTTVSAFSGFRFEYNEPTNTLGLSSILGSTITNVLNVDPFTSITPYTVTFTPFTSAGTGNFVTNVGGTIFYPPALSGIIPSSELSSRFIGNKGAIDGVFFFANGGTVNYKQYVIEFAKDAAFSVQNTVIYKRVSGEISAAIMRPINGSFVNGRIVMPNANATQPWGTSGALIEYPYTAGDSIFYRVGFAYPSVQETMGLSAAYIRILP